MVPGAASPARRQIGYLVQGQQTDATRQIRANVGSTASGPKLARAPIADELARAGILQMSYALKFAGVSPLPTEGAVMRTKQWARTLLILGDVTRKRGLGFQRFCEY